MSGPFIVLPRPGGDSKSILVRIKVFLAELRILRDMIFERLRGLQQLSQMATSELAERGTEAARPFAPNITELNMLAKCYFFISRQTVSNLLRIVFQLREPLGYLNVGHPIPDGSKSKKFRTLIEGIVERRFDYDPDILQALEENRDYLIISRVIRNALKTFGVLTFIVVAREALLVCHLSKEEKLDKTIEMTRKPLSMSREDTENFRLTPSYFDEDLQALTAITELVEEKLMGSQGSHDG